MSRARFSPGGSEARLADRLKLPEPEDVIAGKYRVDCALGSGGMGAVYQVTHRVTGKRFAMKWLLPQASAHGDAAQRFIREAQVAGRFEHPHVVEVYDVGSESDSFYMVMELLEGESLAERVDRTGPLSIPEACTLLIPCMRGVAEAHNAGIVHRDLKPANIFVCNAAKHEPERAKVLDFGISKMSAGPGEINDSMTKSGTLIGTPHYMPLEQIRGKSVDHRADVYAFGVVLYQVLSGKLPYPADSFSDLVLMVAHETPPPLDEVVARMPRGLSQVIAKAMARDAADRYQSMEELIDALEPYATGGHVAETLRTPSGWSLDSSLSLPTPLSTESRVSQRPSEYSKRAPARGAWLAGAAAVLVLVSLVAAAVWMRKDPKEVATPEAAKPDTSAASARKPEVQPTTAARPQTSAADARVTAVLPDERSAAEQHPQAANDEQGQPAAHAAADRQPPPTAAAQPVATPDVNANVGLRPNAPPPATRPLPKRAPSTPSAARPNAAQPPEPPQVRIEPRLPPPELDDVEMMKPEPQARPKPPSNRAPAMSAGDF